MYKLKEATEANKEALKAKFYSMKGQIPCLLDIEAGADLIGSERSFDVCLVCTFGSLDKLKEYLVHPVHLPVKEYVMSRVIKSHSVDYEI